MTSTRIEQSRYMDEPPGKINAQEPEILTLGEVRSGIEFLPIIWDAAEAFTSPSLETRWEGLNRLSDCEAIRNHSLVAYLLFSRLTEPDIALRARVVGALAEVLIPSSQGVPETHPAFDGLSAWLSEMRTPQVFALLQVAEFDKAAEPSVASLIEYCSFTGEYLAEILADRQAPLSIRKQAAHFIGRIGYLDAQPALERLAARLEQRRSRDELLGPQSENDECNLLPLIHNALTVLTAL